MLDILINQFNCIKVLLHEAAVFDLITLCTTMTQPDVVIKSRYPQPMEQMGQNNGYLMYRVALKNVVQLPATIELPIFGDRYTKILVFSDPSVTEQGKANHVSDWNKQ